MNVSPANGGDINVAGQGIPSKYPASWTCSVNYQLTAVPNTAANYKFDRWGGSVSGSTNPISVSVSDDAKNVTAYFKLKTEPKSLQETKTFIDSGPVLVLDVRSASSYATSHMLCAKNYVWNSGANQFSTSITNLTPYKEDDILIYSNNGTQSAAAAQKLADQGFEKVSYMTVAFDPDWIAEYETFTTAEDSGVCTSLSPIAYAGSDQTVDENKEDVQLNGSGSSSGVTYAWTQVEGQNVSLSSPTAQNPTFTAPDLNGGDGELIFHLTVTDGTGKKDTDSVTINVNWNNAPPTANAGPDQTVTPGATVILNGSGSTDPENSIVSYQWNVSGGAGTFPSSLNGPTPSFTVPNSEGWVIYTLTVTDNGGLTGRDTVKVTIAEGANNPPQANAGASQTVTEGAAVALDASGSTDSDGTIASRHWTQTVGINVSLSSRFAVKPTFTAPDVNASTALIFFLTVTDDDGATDTDTVTVTVNDSGGTQEDSPAAPTGVAATDFTPSNKIQITWNASSGAVSYDIYRSDMPAWAGASPKRIAASVSGLLYDDMTTEAGSRYYYWVKARNSGGTSRYSMFDTGYRGSVGSWPAVPTNVDAEDGGAGMVAVSWTASPGTLVYEIYRATIPAYLDFSLTKIATVTDTSYDDGSAVEGIRYYYWVKARNSWGISRYSRFDTGYSGTASSPPAAPLEVTASDGTVSGKVSISWESSTGASGYEIWRANQLVSAGGNPVRIGYVGGVSFDDNTGVCGNTYYYWVKARHSWGPSGYSIYDTGFCN